MSILILSSARDASTPYHEWLAGRSDVHLFCPEGRSAPSFYASVTEFKRYEVNGQLELAAIALHARAPLTAIIARTEMDILRAASLRARLGIQGQQPESALAYRNKISMKKLLNAAGVPCAAFASLGEPMDAIRFTDEHGYPIVIKPVDGAGGKDTVIIKDSSGLATYLEGGVAANMMIESFVPGAMYHVDAFVVDGVMVASSVSKYINSALSFQSQEAWGSYVLPDEDSVAMAMTDFSQRMIDALPAPEYMVIHAEIWRTPDDELVACEIASRTGGSLIARNIRRAKGFDLNALWVKAQVGQDWGTMLAEAESSDRFKGFVILPPRAGVLAAVADCDLPGDVDEYRLEAKIGQRLEGAQKQADCLASLMTTQDTEETVARRLVELATWFETRTTWQAV